MADWAEEYLTLIEDCEKRESRLNSWEREFLDSISVQLEDGRDLSEKQAERLDKIWERLTENG